ncbi:MAG: hypothetical protein R6U98_29365 [Pirellulaceae bacterium]
MDPTLFKLTTVVLGQAHNPTILNPDFLATQGVVPPEWRWEVAETVTTPPFALVRYQNEVTITVEPNKIQVTDPNTTKSGHEQNKAATIALAYVKILPHVNYTAVGINFHAFCEKADPAEYLKNRFLRQGPWDSEAHGLDAVGFRLVYWLAEDCRTTLSIDVGEVKPEQASEAKSAILVTANFHRKCSHRPGTEDVEKHLSQVPSDWKTYEMLVRDALETEE